MKLMLAIVRDEYAADVTVALNQKGHSVTRISSTGGFWRRGNVTLLIGVEEEEVDSTLEIVNSHAGPQVEVQEGQNAFPPHRATIFVLDVDSVARY